MKFNKQHQATETALAATADRRVMVVVVVIGVADGGGNVCVSTWCAHAIQRHYCGRKFIRITSERLTTTMLARRSLDRLV